MKVRNSEGDGEKREGGKGGGGTGGELARRSNGEKGVGGAKPRNSKRLRWGGGGRGVRTKEAGGRRREKERASDN